MAAATREELEMVCDLRYALASLTRSLGHIEEALEQLFPASAIGREQLGSELRLVREDED